MYGCIPPLQDGASALSFAVRKGRDVSLVIKLLRAAPEAAAAPDHLGRLPLHECTEQTSLDVARAVHAAFPAAVEHHAAASASHALPLHAALAGGASLEILAFLLDAHPGALTASAPGSEPLHGVRAQLLWSVAYHPAQDALLAVVIDASASEHLRSAALQLISAVWHTVYKGMKVVRTQHMEQYGSPKGHVSGPDQASRKTIRFNGAAERDVPQSGYLTLHLPP